VSGFDLHWASIGREVVPRLGQIRDFELSRLDEASSRRFGYVRHVKELRDRLGRRELLDIGLAAAFAAVAVVEIWRSGPLSDDPRWAITLLALLMAFALALRRRHPLAVALVIVVLTGVSDIWNVPDETAFVIGVLMVALYSVAAHSELRDAVIGLAAGLGLFVVGTITGGDSLDDLVFVSIICGGVWGAGRVVGSRRQLAAVLAEKNVLLEQEQEARALQAVAEERTRIARELHDVVAHSVSVMVMQAGAERRALGDERPQTREVLGLIEHTGRLALTEMRRLLGMLRKDDDELALAPQPSLEHLDLLVGQVREAGLPVELEVEGTPVALPAGVDLSAYRIVQEALTNALKHAGPARARVRVRYRRDDVELEVVDDGAGEQAEEANGAGGHGLVGMRERVSLFGGDLDAGERHEGGYAVRARLPIERVRA
jgi:signal transduction histidine kinase